MEIIVTQPTPVLAWYELTSDQKAHMNKDFPSDNQQDRFFFLNPATGETTLPADMFFGPVSMSIDGESYGMILTIGAVAYLIKYLPDDGINICLAVI
jgi:hypothetical protein